MYRNCPEFQRLLRAYQRAFAAWGEANKIDGDRAWNGDLEALEKKHRLLTEHQQSCEKCLAELNLGTGLKASTHTIARRDAF